MTAFIPALLIKLTLILAVGLTVAAVLRSLSPSLRHLALFAALASGLALPLVMFMSPQWNVPVLPRSLSATSATSESTANEQSNPSSDSRLLGGITNAPLSGSALSARVIDAEIPQSRSAVRTSLIGLPSLPLLWGLGFLAVLGWLATGRIRLRRIAAESWPLNGSDWSGILEEERRYAGVTKPVLLFSSSVVSTPLTWGSRAPIVLLPEDAIDWPEPHRRVVLRHELAHISRGDSLTQLVAGLACALYWFHPLVWITERRLRAECERACDDSVVSLGTPAAEYAAHLLEVARSARAFGAPGFLSVAMARPSQLEGRLLAVLNESRRRVSVSRGARPAAALLSVLILIPLAAFRAVPQLQEPKDAVASPALSASPKALSPSSSSMAPPPTPILSVEATPTPTVRVDVNTAASPSDGAESALNRRSADSTFQLSVPARSGGTLTLDLKSGGKVIITGSDKSEVFVRVSLGGRDWRDTKVSLEPSETGARLESDFTTPRSSRSTSHTFEISVPRRYDVRISSSGGSIAITGLDGEFTGHTGGGEIDIKRSSGEVDLRTGGGKIHVSDSRLNGSVRTGGGTVTIERVTGDLDGSTGGGSVRNSSSGASLGTTDGATVAGPGSGYAYSTGSGGIGTTTTTTYTNSRGAKAATVGGSGIRMSTGGGPIILPSAPDGAHVTTGGGRIQIGPSGGRVYAQTGGGPIEIGPATGSVEAHTGAGDVTIELKGAGSHSVEVTSGKGEVVLVLPSGIDAILDLETAYTNNLGHKTRIISDWPLQPTETTSWDSREGTPRRYVRARQTVGRGGGVIRVRLVNGNIVVKRRG